METQVKQGDTLKIDYALEDYDNLSQWTCTVQLRSQGGEVIDNPNASLNYDNSAFEVDLQTSDLEVGQTYSAAAQLSNPGLQIFKELNLWVHICPQFNF